MINNETAKSTYVIIENKNDYEIGFLFEYNTDGSPQLKLYYNKRTTEPLEFETDYTISGDGLSVVLVNPTVGDRLDIIRDIPLTQNSDYHIGRIDPEQIERDFDLSVERDQQLKADMQFAIEVPLDHETRIQALEDEVDDIEDLIPNQTSTENQLADKNFVNSSIATSTATFRGTYDTLEDLEAVTADDNDYGFVISVDAVGNTLYARYKYTTATDPASWVFEYYLNNSSFTADQWAAINSGVTKIGWDNVHSTNGYNIGDIFLTARTDTGLNGAVECNGGTYDGTDFTGAQNPVTLMDDGKIPYVSLDVYASTIASQGWCDKFGWDGVGTTTFRVPTLNAYVWQKLTSAVKGSTAILGNWQDKGPVLVTSDADMGFFDKGGVQDACIKDKVDNVTLTGVKADATDSVSTHRVMVQLTVAATDEAVITCTNVAAQVAANTSAINRKVDLTSSWGAPIWNASAKTDFTLSASGSEYTAPADGYFIIQMQNGNLNNHWVNLSVNSIFIGNMWGQVPNNTFSLPVVPVKQGDKLKIDYGSDITGAPVFFHIATQKTN